MSTEAQKVLICGPSERDRAQLRRAVASLTAYGIAVSGRDLVGDILDSIPERKPKAPDPIKQSAAEAKRERRAERNRRQAGRDE